MMSPFVLQAWDFPVPDNGSLRSSYSSVCLFTTASTTATTDNYSRLSVPTDTSRWGQEAPLSVERGAFPLREQMTLAVAATRCPVDVTNPGSPQARVQALRVVWSHTNGWPPPGKRTGRATR